MTILTHFSLHPVFGTVTLGDLIKELDYFLPTLNVEFDFCNTVPDFGTNRNPIASYRGRYAHLAIAWRRLEGGGFVTAHTLREQLRKAVGNPFVGYKGGSYTMDGETPVWVDNWGEATSTAIIGVETIGGAAVLLTKKVET